MTRRFRLLLVALALPAAWGCASGGNGESETAAAGASRLAASADGCPLPADRVSEIIAMPVRLAPRPVRLTDACSYQLVEDPNVEVELAIKPVEIAEILFDGIHSRAKAMLGASAQADPLRLGEEGWVYGSNSASEAAVRNGRKVYHAQMRYLLSATIPSQKEAMERLVVAMMEGQPASP